MMPLCKTNLPWWAEDEEDKVRVGERRFQGHPDKGSSISQTLGDLTLYWREVSMYLPEAAGNWREVRAFTSHPLCKRLSGSTFSSLLFHFISY